VPEMVTAAATSARVPPELLAAIAWVESRGWPWAINIGGVGLYPRNYSDAVKLIRAVRGRADIGVAQIHYPIWGPVFGLQPEDLLDPWINLHVAARILKHAIDQEPGSWGGVGRYHSATPWRKWQYAHRVAIVAGSFNVTSVSPPK
jgi:Transglycosylase SLT domain